MVDFPTYLPLSHPADRAMAIDRLLEAGKWQLAERIQALGEGTRAVLVVGAETVYESFLLASIDCRDVLATLESLASGDDLAAVWPGLDDDDRDWLIEINAVAATAEAEVDVLDAETIVEDWRAESGASWPTYTLALRPATGDHDDIELRGWHFADENGVQGNSDGSESGLVGRRDYRQASRWHIEQGSNVGDDIVIPVWRGPDGHWLTYDRDDLDRAIEAAVDDVDHGGLPHDLSFDECNDGEAPVYVVVDGKVVEVEIWSGGALPYHVEEEDYGCRVRRVTRYHVTGWVSDVTDHNVYASRDDLLEAIERGHDVVYETREAALASDELPECSCCGKRGPVADDETDPGDDELTPDDEQDGRLVCGECLDGDEE